VPVFSLAALWNASARPDQAAEALARMARWELAARPPEIHVARLELEVSAEIRVELTHYPRAFVAALAAEIERSGGALVELWRLPKADRDAFRASVLGGAAATLQRDAEEAARAVREHLEALARRAAPAASGPPYPRAERGDEQLQAPLARLRLAKIPHDAASVTPARPGPESRRARRYDVALEVEFGTHAELAREHAVNISRGGLFIRTGLRPELDSVALVTVQLPTGEKIQGEALVVHHREGEDEGGVGLAFLSEDRAFSERLERYLAELASPGAAGGDED
jgi:uncharacterized protein (TIGR02266 family)